MPRRTIAREISAEGAALHSGAMVRLTLAPAEAGRGIVFRRSDLGGREIPARYDRVSQTRLGTTIDDGDGISVGVIEHLMAAIAGTQIDDMEIVLDGPEPPILDGDALSYLTRVDEAGISIKAGTKEAIKILRHVEVCDGGARASLSPANEREFDFEIDFTSAMIGRQHLFWKFSESGFRQDIAPARTFGFVHELNALNQAGLARGASLDNTLAIDGDKIVNASLRRFNDEFVRHKILDAIGDLALAGGPVIGRFEGRRSGHALNNRLLRMLFADSKNFIRLPLP